MIICKIQKVETCLIRKLERFSWRSCTIPLVSRFNYSKRKLKLDKRLFKDRQILWYIKNYFKFNTKHRKILDFANLNVVKMQGTDISRLLHDWDSVLLAINKISDKIIMESLVFGQLEKTDILKNMLEFYRLDITQNGKPKSYERLLDMVQKHLV